MGSMHPNHAVHLQHFLDSAADYENLQDSLPLPREADGFTPMSDTERWIVVLHAMVLRKYFVPDKPGSEQLRLSAVARSLRTCYRGDALTHDWDAIVENIAVLDPLMEYVRDGSTRSEQEVATDRLYGRHLHGDYDKWQRACRRRSNLTH